MMRKMLFIAVFGLGYTVGTAWVMVSAMGAALSGFEPGEPRASAATIELLELLMQALMFPLIPLVAPHARGQWFYLLVFGNGVLWGVALVALWSALTRSRYGRPTGSSVA
jgi:hypothetical protein